MIYQKLKKLIIDDKPFDSDFVKSEIDQHLDSNPNSFQPLVEGLIRAYLINRENIDLINTISESFTYLFSKGLKWSELQDIEILTKDDNDTRTKIKELNNRVIKPIIKPAFNEFFPNEFRINTIAFKETIFDFFSDGLLNDETLLKVGNHLNFHNNIEVVNKFMLSTNSFTEMKQLEKVFNLNKWSVVSKKNDIETLWPVHVWHMENRHLHAKLKTSIKEKRRLFWEDNEIFHNMKTDKTSNLDFISRFVFASCNITDEKYYSELLKDLNIEKINLDCIEYNNRAEKVTVREKMLRFGHIKLVNRFEKKDKKSNTTLENIITAVPAKAYMISNKKAFFKQFVNNLDKDINHTNLLETVLATKSRLYANSHYDVKCYLPLKKDYLDHSKEYWQQRKVDSYVFMDFPEHLQTDAKLKSFINLIEWVEDKDIQWTKRTKTGNYLITDAIIASMQFPSELYVRDLSKNNHVLSKQFHLLNHIHKIEILEQIKNNWEKIWDSCNENRHQHEILNTPYKKPSNTFTFMNNFINDCLKDHVRISDEFFDEKWNTIINVFKKFENDDEQAKEFLRLADVIELESTLTTSNHKTSIKKIKV